MARALPLVCRNHTAVGYAMLSGCLPTIVAVVRTRNLSGRPDLVAIPHVDEYHTVLLPECNCLASVIDRDVLSCFADDIADHGRIADGRELIRGRSAVHSDFSS